MGLKPDHWIRKMAHEHKMIEPFVENQVREGVISYGVSSYGYDVRVANEFKIFTNVFSSLYVIIKALNGSRIGLMVNADLLVLYARFVSRN